MKDMEEAALGAVFLVPGSLLPLLEAASWRIPPGSMALTCRERPHSPLEATAFLWHGSGMRLSGDRAISDLIPQLRPFWTRYGVRKAWLFGSRATSVASPESDWDFLVDFASAPGFDSYMDLKLGLEKSLGSRVDILSRSACKGRFLKAIERDLLDVS
jgi:hypothetical protein